MANEQNLVSLADRTTEEKREIGIKGGIASGKARRQKKTMRETLEQMLDEVANIEGNKDKLTYRQLATLGLLKGAVQGNNANYKTILETIGEIQESQSTTTPTLNVNIIDNSKLEGTLYEENRHNENDNG
jgi:hypothetical protein